MRLPVDEAAWEARTPPGKFVRDGDVYRFIVPGRSDVVNAPVSKDKQGNIISPLSIDVTERSSGQKALYKYLVGEDFPTGDGQ